MSSPELTTDSEHIQKVICERSSRRYAAQMRVLIVGCGYVGLALGAELVRQGHEVTGVRRGDDGSGELRRAGIRPISLDVTAPEVLKSLDDDFDWIVNTISSSKGGVGEYRSTYYEGTARLIEWLSSQKIRRYVYTSSTSVYPQTDGSIVTEESPTEPDSETSRILVETENLVLNAAQQNDFPGVILRVAGIYGPGRGHLFQQFLRGEAHITGDGSRWINMIQRDDVAAAIIAALERGRTGGIYNASDDEPVTQKELLSWFCAQLRRPVPPPMAESEAPLRKRTVTSKRISNRKLRLELRCELKYPTFRQGYSAEIARLQAAGQLPVGAGQ